MSIKNRYNIKDLNLSYLSIYDCPYQKMRIGSSHDGGYVICNGLKCDILLGCGISNDITFENDYLNLNKDIYCFAFDGTVNNLPNNANNRINFIKKNIGYNSNNTTNLDFFLNTYNDIFLKMDIECGEYEWIKSITKDQLNNIKQIAIEIHFDLFDNFREDKWDIMKILSETHYLVHLHGNNCGNYIIVNGILLPETIECLYIRKNEISNPQKISFNGPTEYDRQNDINKPDLLITIPNNI
jgi:hypothetical protein